MKPLSKFAISVGIFTLAGPPIGLIGYLIALTVMSFSVNSILFMFSELFFVVLFFGIFMSYLVSGISALIAGIVFGMIIARKCLSVPLGAAVGFMAGVVSVFVYFYGDVIHPAFNSVFLMVGVSGFAGAVCGYLTNRIINRKQPRDLSSSNASSHAAQP